MLILEKYSFFHKKRCKYPISLILEDAQDIQKMIACSIICIYSGRIMTNHLDFHFINDQLLNMGAVHSASELQGYLCGLISGGRRFVADEWLILGLEFMDLTDIQPKEQLDDLQKELFADIYNQTLTQLDDSQCLFTPMLPTESSSIERRIDELGCWCQGFLHGVGASGLQGENTMTSESAEALRDLAQISQVAIDEEANDEENETHWTELVEYVRAAVMIFYTDITQPVKNNADETKIIH